MAKVRKKNRGTWDVSQNRWELKAKGVRKSPKQLGEIFGEDVPQGKIGSRPYWERYLRLLDEQEEINRRKTTQFVQRVKSLDQIIESLEIEGRDTAAFVKERNRVLALEHDIDEIDFPALHPDIPGGLVEADSELKVRFLNSLVIKRKATVPTVKSEIEQFIPTKKTDQPNYRLALDLFVKAVGDIPISEIDILQYRKYKKLLDDHKTWNQTTKAKMQRRVHTWLNATKRDHNQNWNWVDDRRHMIEVPDGEKEQYSIEQVKTALAHAEGLGRCALLLGLNIGAITGDIEDILPQEVGDTHIIRVRSKNRHRKPQLQGTWKLWPETREALIFGETDRRIRHAFDKVRRLNGPKSAPFVLPEHEALRKTVAQIIHDHHQEDEGAARLYRCEKVEGCHGKNYIRMYTPAQIERLDVALDKVHGILFG